MCTCIECVWVPKGKLNLQCDRETARGCGDRRATGRTTPRPEDSFHRQSCFVRGLLERGGKNPAPTKTPGSKATSGATVPHTCTHATLGVGIPIPALAKPNPPADQRKQKMNLEPPMATSRPCHSAFLHSKPEAPSANAKWPSHEAPTNTSSA